MKEINEVQVLLDAGATIATEEDLSRVTATDRKVLPFQSYTTKADWLRSEIEKLEGEKLPYPYVCKSPFPGEGVDFHLKTYGHLPYFGCCKYDQLTKDETDVYNQALTSIITRYKEELKVLESE